jgi:hypothetical protein
MTTINVKRIEGMKQATRTEPAKPMTQWLVFTPVGPVSCNSVIEAEQLAKSFGCAVSLITN